MSNIARMNRRTILRGMMGGTAVGVGLQLLDCFLNTNGTAPTASPPWFITPAR
jgi:hypothetical protein